MPSSATSTEPPGPPLVFGDGRIHGGWIGIGIAAAAFLIMATAQLAAGAPVVLLAVGPVLLLFALLCAVTRQLRILPEARVVLVTRRLLGLAITRRLPLARYGRVAVTMAILRPRHSRSDHTLAGDQIHTHYTVWLRGRGAVRVADFHNTGDPTGTRLAAEELAAGLARRLGLRAERRGYGLQARADGCVLAVPRRGAVAPLP